MYYIYYIYICAYVSIYNSVFVSFSPQDFHIIPGGFCYLPGDKFTASSHPEKFPPVSQGVPTRVLRQGVLILYNYRRKLKMI